MDQNDPKIKEILLKQNYISKEDLETAEDFAKDSRSTFIDYLLTNGLITNDLLGQAIAESLKIDYADLNSHPAIKENVLLIPEKIAKKYRIVVFSNDDKKVTIATDHPEDSDKWTDLKKYLDGKKITIAYSLTRDIDEALIHYQKDLVDRFKDLLSSKKRVAPEIIEEILNEAINNRASDIHIEPQREEVLIRLRIDGVLHDVGSIPKDLYENVLNWIKVRAHLRIDEHLAAQDGSMRYETSKYPVDLRISIVPTLDGEKACIRMLSQYVRSYTLGDIGLNEKDQKIVSKTSKMPFGMILVTGPTGSGKTTTLYSVLRVLNTRNVNITTIEDPVEYKVQGINQIQVNQRTGLTFAKGLRTIVRQDPNVILVGEIRDIETAEIAVNAALTGHLLLSTFHANDASTAVPRLLDMGIETFLLASTLQIVIAQRLARTICESCRYSVTYTQEELKEQFEHAEKYFPNKTTTLYKGKGCKNCNGTGYKGRTALFEIVYISQSMRELILTNPSSQQIYELARKEGAHTLFEDGIDKVKRGMTTLEEVMRVATAPEDNNIYQSNGKKKKD